MAKHRADVEPSGDPQDGEPQDAAAPRPRIRRRVTTEPVPGSDPHPSPEPQRHAPGENDEQLKRDVPPHWGSD